jgi:hypothetical protein
MSEHHDAPLSEDARALLDAFTADETPTAQQQDDVWASVSRDTPPPRRLQKVETGPQPATTPAPRRTWIWVAAAVAAAAAAVLVLGDREGQQAQQRQSQQEPHTAPYQAAPTGAEGRAEEGTPAPIRTMARQVPAPVPPEVDTAEPPAEEELEPPPLQRPSTRHPAGTDARAEIEALRRAKQALAEGRASEALKILDAPGRARGRGQLGREREALRVEALCAVGQTDRAAKEAKLLLERMPQHPYASKLRRPCSK